MPRFPIDNLTHRCMVAPMTDTTTALLTAAEVAERLGTTVATVNRWAANGKLPTAHKLPGIRGARLFREADVEAVVS